MFPEEDEISKESKTEKGRVKDRDQREKMGGTSARGERRESQISRSGGE